MAAALYTITSPVVSIRRVMYAKRMMFITSGGTYIQLIRARFGR